MRNLPKISSRNRSTSPPLQLLFGRSSVEGVEDVRRVCGGCEGRLLFAAFEEEGEEDLVEALCDVDGDVVDAVLHGALLEVGLLA